MNEISPVWRKACHSNSQCVETARAVGGVAVRDSKHPHVPHLNLTVGQFGAVLNHLKEN